MFFLPPPPRLPMFGLPPFPFISGVSRFNRWPSIGGKYDSFTPFPWQEEAAQHVLRYKKVLFKIPMGAGKTYAAWYTWKKLEQVTGLTDYIVVVPALDLQKQWSAEAGMNPEMIQSFINRIEEFRESPIKEIRNLIPLRTNLLILDEADRYEAKEWSKIYDLVNPNYLIGMTGTPMGCEYRFNDVYEITPEVADLAKVDGYIYYFRCENKVMMEYEEISQQMKALEWVLKQPFNRTLDPIRTAYELLSYARKRLVHNSRNRHLLSVHLFSQYRGFKTLVFTKTVRQAYILGQAIGVKCYYGDPRPQMEKEKESYFAKMVRFHRRDDPELFQEELERIKYSARVTPYDPILDDITQEWNASEHDRNREDFKAGRIDSLVVVDKLSQGYDVPDIDTVFLAAVSGSDRAIGQRIGRGVRKFIDPATGERKRCKVVALVARGTSDEKVAAKVEGYSRTYGGVPTSYFTGNRDYGGEW